MPMHMDMDMDMHMHELLDGHATRAIVGTGQIHVCGLGESGMQTPSLRDSWVAGRCNAMA